MKKYWGRFEIATIHRRSQERLERQQTAGLSAFISAAYDRHRDFNPLDGDNPAKARCSQTPI
jgi:hypothetical protein